MLAIESRLLVLSPKNKDHKTTTTTGCKCRDKVPPQPQTERKVKAPKKNDKETNNNNELHVVADPQMPVCLTEFPPLSPASEERPINCRNAVGQDDTEAPNTTNASAAVPTSTDNNGQDNNKNTSPEQKVRERNMCVLTDNQARRKLVFTSPNFDNNDVTVNKPNDVPPVGCSNIDKATSNSADPRQKKMLFNEVAKLEGPWLRSRHEIKKDRYLEKTNARTDSRTSIHKRSLALKAAVPERGCTLYLQHIHMPPGDEAQHVIASIRSYVRDSSPSRKVRIMKANVIHNRAYDDVVGCRLVVPEVQAAHLLRSGYWPDGMVCRRWETQPPRRWQPRDPKSHNNYTDIESKPKYLQQDKGRHNYSNDVDDLKYSDISDAETHADAGLSEHAFDEVDGGSPW